jgi:hypothetical protein
MTTVPLTRRLLFPILRRAAGGDLDAEAIWTRADFESTSPHESLLELRLAARAKRVQWLVAWASLFVFAACVLVAWWVGPRAMARVAAAGHPGLALLAPLLAGVVLHGAFILLVHEATHFNLFHGPVDRWIGNVALGTLLLPFFAETYQHTHLVHHRHVNRLHDNNWTRNRHFLFRRSRLLYALYELIPVVNNVDRVGQRIRRRAPQIVAAWLAAAAVVAASPVSWRYYLLALVGINTINAMRLWVEHYGHFSGNVSNTYRCPFSFGIGNHEMHHRYPKIPALVLMVGLWFRRPDVTVLSAPFRVLFTPGWSHFRTQQDDFDGTVL